MQPPRTEISIRPKADDFSGLLLAVASQRDPAAFSGLFQHFAPRVKSYLYRSGVPLGQAEELAQETLVSVWHKAHTFDRNKAQVSTWIFTIARNLRIDALRRGAETPGHEESGGGFEACDIPDDGPSLFDRVAGEEAGAQVRAAINGLPDEQRQILHLSFFESEPHAAIAHALAIPLGTVKSRIRLAIAHLRQQLEHLDRPDP